MSEETKNLVPAGITGNFGVVKSDSKEENKLEKCHISIMSHNGQFVFAKWFHDKGFLSDKSITYGGILWDENDKKMLITIGDNWKEEVKADSINAFALGKTKDGIFTLKVSKSKLLNELDLYPDEDHKFKFILGSDDDDIEVNTKSKYAILDFSNKTQQPTEAKIKADKQGKFHRELRRLYTEDPEGFARKLAEMDDPRWWESNEDFWQQAETYRIGYDTYAVASVANPPKK